MSDSSSASVSPALGDFTILLFARARDLLSSPRVVLPASELIQFLSNRSTDSESTADGSISDRSSSSQFLLCDLFSFLLSRYPQLVELFPHSLMAVNGDYADPMSQLAITTKDEIAIIPPISGG